ncbi:TetR/AcrR family transcriptional regulator [Pseudodonghicola xiamenensis]|uniref:TetR family transcriptional regulator n=1 Tax=Pseudodonghicola xiamenensis TaxID=337702 RepID=A0A8J3MCS3_9RHOB|nr:TetR/AcrR family transcriptional regulator [Pseudodonghicola xiamenensis]GHG93506.1 TetR family transcriptional regulator [Pseudodonghicola xiamenensis]
MARKASYDRDEVLQKALELFWAKGYHATSLKDLEVALDMRPGSIYAAFGSKEALFAETLKRYAERSQVQFDRTIAGAPTPLAGLAAHVRALGCPPEDKAPPSRACMLVKTLLETPDDGVELRRLTEERMQGIEAGFATVFRAARDAGQIAPDSDPERLARRLQAAVFGLRAYAQRSDAGGRTAELAEDIARDLEALAVR